METTETNLQINPFTSAEIEQIKVALCNYTTQSFPFGIHTTIVRLIATVDELKFKLRESNIIKESDND